MRTGIVVCVCAFLLHVSRADADSRLLARRLAEPPSSFCTSKPRNPKNYVQMPGGVLCLRFTGGQPPSVMEAEARRTRPCRAVRFAASPFPRAAIPPHATAGSAFLSLKQLSTTPRRIRRAEVSVDRHGSRAGVSFPQRTPCTRAARASTAALRASASPWEVVALTSPEAASQFVACWQEAGAPAPWLEIPLFALVGNGTREALLSALGEHQKKQSSEKRCSSSDAAAALSSLRLWSPTRASAKALVSELPLFLSQELSRRDLQTAAAASGEERAPSQSLGFGEKKNLRLLWPTSALAADTLETLLLERKASPRFMVERINFYTTLPTRLSRGERQAALDCMQSFCRPDGKASLEEGICPQQSLRSDDDSATATVLVLLTSPSTAKAWALNGLPLRCSRETPSGRPSARGACEGCVAAVCIGETTAAAARAVGEKATASPLRADSASLSLHCLFGMACGLARLHAGFQKVVSPRRPGVEGLASTLKERLKRQEDSSNFATPRLLVATREASKNNRLFEKLSALGVGCCNSTPSQPPPRQESTVWISQRLVVPCVRTDTEGPSERRGRKRLLEILSQTPPPGEKALCADTPSDNHGRQGQAPGDD